MSEQKYDAHLDPFFTDLIDSLESLFELPTLVASMKEFEKVLVLDFLFLADESVQDVDEL